MPTVDRVIVELEAKVDQYIARTRQAEKEWGLRMRGIEGSATRMERSVQRSTTNAGRALATFVSGVAIAAVIRQTGDLADAWTEAGNQIASATEISGRQARSLEQLRQSATDARASFEPYVNLYSRLLRSTKDVAQSELEVARATDITARAFKAGGAATSEQIAGILQLSQALGSGLLAGDELRSIRENAPLLAQAIADEFGTTIAGLKKLGEEGELTSERVFRAILNAQPKIEAAFARTNATIDDSFVRLRNSIVQYVGTSEAVANSAALVQDVIGKLSDDFEAFADAAIIAAGVIGGVFASQALGKLVTSLSAATKAEVQYRAALASGNLVAINGAVAARQRAEAAVSEAAAQLGAAAAAERKAVAEAKGAAAVRASIAGEVGKANAVLRTVAAEAASAQAEAARLRAIVQSDTARKQQTTTELNFQRALAQTGAANQVAAAAARDQAATQALTASRSQLLNAEIRLTAAQKAQQAVQQGLVVSRLELAQADRLAAVATEQQALATTQLAGAQAAAAKTGDVLTAATARATLGARAATVAFAAFNRVLAFFGGPVGAAIFAIGAAITIMSLRAQEARVSFEEFDQTLNRFNKTMREIDSDQQRLAALQELLDKNEDITDAIRAQGFASREALLIEVDAINKRISKNKELAEVYKATLQVQVAALEASTRQIENEISVVRSAARERERIFKGQFEVRRDSVKIEGAGEGGKVLSQSDLALKEAEVDAIIAKRREELSVLAEQGKLTEREIKELDQIRQLQEANLQLAEKRAALAALGQQAPAETPTTPNAPAGALSSEELKENERLLRKINDAYADLFETELAGIERVRQERIEAVRDAKLSEQEKAAAIVKINATAEEQVRLLREESAREELELINGSLDARDRALGRVLTIAQREFDERIILIDRELEALRKKGVAEVEIERIKNEQLRLLAQERAAFEAEARAALPTAIGDGEIQGLPTEDSIAAEVARIEEIEAAKLQALQDALEARIIVEEDYERRRIEIIRSAEQEIQNIRAKALQIQLNSAASTFGKLAQATGRFIGEQSTAYRVLFGIQQSFAVASAIVATSRGVAEALGRYPPDYLNAALIAAGGAAEVATILAQGFKAGGVVGDQRQRTGMVSGPGSGTSDSIATRLPRGAFVVNAAATRKFRPQLEAIRRGEVPVNISNGEFVVDPSKARRNLPLLEAINSGRLPSLDDEMNRRPPGGRKFNFASGGLVDPPNVSIPTAGVRHGQQAAPIVNVAPPVVDVTNINTFDGAQALSEALAARPGSQVLLNYVQRNRVALRSALGIGGRNGT